MDSPVPVDLIPLNQLLSRSGNIDLNAILHTLSPSFNANRQHGADGSDHIDPASLRGLGPDQLLVLINGKRRHNSSLINIFGSSGKGNVGTDMNAIPVSAIKNIEVLRDGAAAQYGSDAIAGVINIVLKEEEGTQFSFQTGQYDTDYNSPAGDFSATDGDTIQLLASHTIAFDNSGFLNLSFDYQDRDNTNRTYGVGSEPLRSIGSSQVENTSGFFNLALPLGEDSEFYSFGGISRREGLAGAFTRTADSARNIASIYPNGFVPNIGSDIFDDSLAIGINGGWKGWSYDISNTYGKNRFEYTVSNTLNASLGALSPTEFDAGGFEFSQNTINVDLSRQYDVLYALNIAGGFEFRNENYRIFAGEEGSFILGNEPPINGSPRPAGSQGFPGFTPENATDQDRDSQSVYFDAELEINDALMLGAAIRAEDYSDFGNTVNYKLVGRWYVSDNLALRFGYNTGFRAPSLHQLYFNTTFTDVEFNSDTNELVTQDELLAANDSDISRTIGVPQLDAENSDSFSVGFTWSLFDSVDITLDAYRIDIEDRVVLTKGISQSRLASINSTDALAFLEANNIASVQFFVNAIDTKTQGIDLTISHDTEVGLANLSTFFGVNYNNTNVVGEPNTPEAFQGLEGRFLARRERKFIESGAPNLKASLSSIYELNNFSIGSQITYFGDVNHAASSGNPEDDQFYAPKTTVDLNFSYHVNDAITLTAGANNIFDQYPDEQNPDLVSGALWRSVQMGINGRFLFLRASADF
nr:TonB-dependent receptor [Marinibactrum halimedae]